MLRRVIVKDENPAISKSLYLIFMESSISQGKNSVK